MTDLNETFISGKGHDQNWKLNYSRLLMFFNSGLVDHVVIFGLLLFLNLFQKSKDSLFLLTIILHIREQIFFLFLQLLNFFFQKVSQLLFTSMVLIG